MLSVGLPYIRFQFSDAAAKASATVLEQRRVSAQTASIGRSSDNRRFRSPNYSAWRRSRTESLLSNARYFYLFSPLRPLRSRARRTSHRSLRYAPAGGWRGCYCSRVGSYKPILARISCCFDCHALSSPLLSSSSILFAVSRCMPGST
jgi:hypothetical protein